MVIVFPVAVVGIVTVVAGLAFVAAAGPLSDVLQSAADRIGFSINRFTPKSVRIYGILFVLLGLVLAVVALS
jgi:hypothetical protein